MSRVLVVEDSRTFSSLLSRRITQELGHEVVVAASLAQAAEVLAQDVDFLAALLDINLPDAPKGEVVDLVLERGIPSIVFTGEMDNDLRERFWAKHIVDYVLKQNLENVQYMLSIMERLARNPGIKVLVVDDSQSARHGLCQLLRVHRYQVLEAGGGTEALALVAKHPDLRLVITDYNMPGMDGFELTRSLRRDHTKNHLAIIGLSGAGGVAISAQFLKSGANDFLHKPFLAEEFYVRVTQNIELLEYISQIHDLANKDFLTKLYSRRYFFTVGEQRLAAQRRAKSPVCLAMLDIDHFKCINDTYGHDAGDAVLQHMSALLISSFRDLDIVARFGGEEFCVLAVGMSAQEAGTCFEALRQRLADDVPQFGCRSIPFTVSIGLCCQQLDKLESMIKAADGALYESKNSGRNRVTHAAELFEGPAAGVSQPA